MYFNNSIRPEDLRIPINNVNDTRLTINVLYRDGKSRQIDNVYKIYDDSHIITILSYDKNFIIPIDMIYNIEILPK